MSIQKLPHRIDLQQRAASVDAIGQPSTNWVSVGLLWASVRHLTGLSAIKAGADTSSSKVSIRIRQRAVDAGQRIVYGSQVFDILAVLPNGKNTFIDLVCEATS